MTDLRTLSELSDAATQGEWGVYGDTIYGSRDENDISPFVCWSCNPHDAAFIAAAVNALRNPASLVKPLVWKGFEAGSYFIQIEEGGLAYLYCRAIPDEDGEPECIKGGFLSLVSLDEFKAAAEAHHVAHVLSMLNLPAKEEGQ